MLAFSIRLCHKIVLVRRNQSVLVFVCVSANMLARIVVVLCVCVCVCASLCANAFTDETIVKIQDGYIQGKVHTHIQQ